MTSGALLLGLLAVLASVGAVTLVLRTIYARRAEELAASIRSRLTSRDAPAATGSGSSWEQLGSAVDAMIAAHDRRRDRLAQARELRMELVDALHVPAALFDRDGRLVWANAASREQLGVAERAASPIQAVADAHLAGAVEEAIDVRRPVELQTTAGDRHLVAIAAPVGDEVLLLVTDETERRRVTEVRRDFVVNASHELKTPVAGIQALAEALSATVHTDEERTRSLLERLTEEAERLAKLVHELLNLRRLEDDGALDTTPVDLAHVVRGEIERLRSRAARREVELDVDLPDEAVVVGVEADLRLVVANLVDNAIGYNRRGGRVAVRLSRADSTWTLEVSDTGIGIARPDLDRIFERFYRVDVARSRATGGTGLGLAIVRHAVERHGGSIEVDSVLGEGSTFAVTLPVDARR